MPAKGFYHKNKSRCVIRGRSSLLIPIPVSAIQMVLGFDMEMVIPPCFVYFKKLESTCIMTKTIHFSSVISFCPSGRSIETDSPFPIKEQAKIAEEAGACAVMALERIPADIRAAGGVSRMSDPKMIKDIQEAVSIPVMAKCRIGHFVEAQILQDIEIDYIDESEVLSPADDIYHIDKTEFKVPFVCGARDLGEAMVGINPSEIKVIMEERGQ